ncbi:hypothetical protein M0Q97_00845 [Candidatus Dojkabacteria bacterium]|jgi:hypothetical protein|nr:hypothetical protein [Candidatus Dojkabacteria bacterium]
MKDYEIIEGKIKYLFSAPHPHLHRRPSLAKIYKEHERYTDDIVRALCKETGCFGIYIKDQVDYDPNFNRRDNPYKKEIERLITENKIEKFVDIHGLSEERLVDVVIFYKTRFSNSIKLAGEISEKLNRGGLRGLNIQILRLPEDGRETLTEFVVSNLRIPSVQVEIAKYLRDDKELRKEIVRNLTDIVS